MGNGQGECWQCISWCLSSKGLKCKISPKIICPTWRYRHLSLFFIWLRGKCYFVGMNNPEKNCPELTMQTAKTIDDSTLNHLFVSTQMNNLDLCIDASLQWESCSKCQFKIFHCTQGYLGTKGTPMGYNYHKNFKQIPTLLDLKSPPRCE